MRTLPHVFSVALLTVLAFAANTSLAADTNVTGAWAATIEVQGRARETTMNLKQEGQKLSGTFINAAGTEVPVTGTLVGDKITFSYKVTGIQVRGGDQNLADNLFVTYNGTVANNAITATANNQLAGEIKLNAKRK